MMYMMVAETDELENKKLTDNKKEDNSLSQQALIDVNAQQNFDSQQALNSNQEEEDGGFRGKFCS
jgi:hypothetical protein